MTIPIQFRIEEELFENIKHEARLISATEDRDFCWRDLIREVLKERFQIDKKDQ